jgi:MFS family permease
MPILLLTIVMSGLGFGLVLPGFLFFAENLGASPAVATMIVGTYAVGQFLANMLWGPLSDRYGRKPMLLISMAGSAASYLTLALAQDLWVLGVARALNGIMSGNLAVAMAYVADVTPVEKRAQGMGYVGGAISLGFIMGPALGGLLGGADAASASLLLPGLVAAATSVITAVGTILFLKESLPVERRRRSGSGPSQGALQAAKTVVSRPVLAQMVFVGFLVYFAMAQFETIFPLWSHARFAWGPREVGISFTYLGLLVGLTQGVLVGRLVPRFGEGRLVVTGLISYAIGLVIMIQAPSWQLMLFGITFTAMGGALFITTMSSMASKQAAEHERGLVLGVYQSGSWLGRAAGPPVSGLLFEHVSVNGPLVLAAFTMLPCLSLVAVILARVRRAALREAS